MTVDNKQGGVKKIKEGRQGLQTAQGVYEGIAIKMV
jgi:hypothetical protein